MNHYASMCRYAKQKVHAVEYEDEDEEEYEVVETEKKWLSAVHSHTDTRSYAMMKVNECEVKFLLDPGATVNCINSQFVHRSQLKPTTSQLFMWNKAKQPCLGEAKLKVKNPKNDREYDITFSVVENDLQCILAQKHARKWN